MPEPSWTADMHALWLQMMRRCAFEFVQRADAEQLRKLQEFVALTLARRRGEG